MMKQIYLAAMICLLVLFSPLSALPQSGEEVKPATLAGLVPEDTYLFISLPSLQQAWQGFTSLPLYEAYQDEEVQTFLDSLGEGVEEMLPSLRMDMLDQLLNLPEVFDGEAAFALLPPAEEEDWVLCLEGRSAPEKVAEFTANVLYPFLSGLFAYGPLPVTLEEMEIKKFVSASHVLYVAELGGQVLFTPKKEIMAGILGRLDSGEKTLLKQEAFQGAAQRMQAGDASFFVYFSLAELVKRSLSEGDLKDTRILTALGFQGIRSLCASMTMAEGRARETIWLDLPEDRKGLLDTFSNVPLDIGLARLAPENTLLLAGGALNIAELHQVMQNVSAAQKAGSSGNLVLNFEDIFSDMGAKAFSDLVGQLGTELLMFVALPKAGVIPEFAAAVEVLEPDRLQTNLFAMIRTVAGTEPKTSTYKNRQICYLDVKTGRMSMDMQLGSFCWCVTDGYLLISHHPFILKGMIRRLDSGKRSLKDDTEFAEAWKNLPKEAAAVGYANSRRLFLYTYNLFVFIMSWAGDEMPFDVALLPSAEVIADYLSFGLSGLTVEEDGICLRTESDGYGPTSFFLYGVTAAALIFPFESWGESLTNHPVCGSHMENIHESMETYRQNHQAYPPTLLPLEDTDDWRFRWIRCPQASLDQDDRTRSSRDRAITEDFTYVVAVLEMEPPESFPEDWMIVWDSEARHNGGRVVLLGYGDVIWLPEEEFQKRLQEQKK